MNSASKGNVQKRRHAGYSKKKDKAVNTQFES
jgi:hypothetical protein